MKQRTFIQPGDRFHRLTVVEYSHTGKHHRRYFHFRCDCGELRTITAEAVISGNTKSCGCLGRDVRKAQALPSQRGAVNQIILGYKRHARDRGFRFELTYEEVDGLIRQPCRYCGDPAGNTKRTKNCRDGFRHNGLDRADSSGHYTIGNVVPCCGLCNRAKRDTSEAAFINWAVRIARHAGGLDA